MVTIDFILENKEKTIRNIPLSKKNYDYHWIMLLNPIFNLLRQLRIHSFYIQYYHSV